MGDGKSSFVLVDMWKVQGIGIFRRASSFQTRGNPQGWKLAKSIDIGADGRPGTLTGVSAAIPSAHPSHSGVFERPLLIRVVCSSVDDPPHQTSEEVYRHLAGWRVVENLASCTFDICTKSNMKLVLLASILQA